jgi:hypothetical protein
MSARNDILEELNQAYGAFLQTNNPEEEKMLCTRCRKREVYDYSLFGHPLCQDCTKKGYIGQGISGRGLSGERTYDPSTDPSLGYSRN